MQEATQNRPRFDPVQFLGRIFGYLRHVRLMLLMLALGLLAGVVYFTHSRPVFESRSLVYYNSFGTPLRDREVAESVERTGTIYRVILDRLRSKRIHTGAVKRMGLIGPSGTWEDAIIHVPVYRVGIQDQRHIVVSVHAYDPRVVKAFPIALIEEYKAFQAESWEEYRDDALSRYSQQLLDLEDKISESLGSLANMERENRLTEVTIEQTALLAIPKRLVEGREQLVRMEDARKTLQAFQAESQANPAQSELDRTITLLSLLGSFDAETKVEVGNVLRTKNPGQPTRVSGLIEGSTSSSLSMEIVTPSEATPLEPWRELEAEHRRLQNELAEASKVYGPDNPVIRDLQQQIVECENGLSAELATTSKRFELEYERLEKNLQVLESRMPEYYQVTEELARSSNSFKEMEEARDMWDKARDRLADKLATITFSEDFDWIELRFKEFLSLRDEVPVSPNKTKLALMSLILGLAGAIGVPTVLNLLDTSASTVQQLKEVTGLAGIGIVPLCDPNQLEEVHRSPAQDASVPNFLLEAFRVIRSSIILNPNRHKHSQVVMVTSSRPQEGKTTQAANLAWAFHSMGEKTLLLDCDLRRGRVHDLLDVPNQPGQTRLLMDQCSVEDALEPTGLPGFDVIPRGPVIAGTTEILCQERFEELIDRFRKQYDRIVIDTPPVLGLSETTSLQRVVDGVVLVVRAETTSRKDVADAIQLLRKTDAHFFGFVLNAVDLSKAANYYNYYYYSAPYYDQFTDPDGPASSDGATPAGATPQGSGSPSAA